MGSVLDYIECPNCKHEASDDFYYKTGEEYIFCEHCGYRREVTILNRDKSLKDLTDADWDLKETKNPLGAYRITVNEGVGSELGSFESEEQIEQFRKQVLESLDELQCCEISRYVNGIIIKEKLK